MRPLLHPALLLATLALIVASASGEDIVRLRRGGSLRGKIRSRTEHEIVLVLASGEIRIPRSQVARIETARDGDAVGVRIIKRDEWSFLIESKRVAGWVRILHWERADLVHVEEHRVIFACAGTPRRERRRVEIVDREGKPREYLWMESEIGRMEVWSGQIQGKRHVRQHRHGGRILTDTLEWPADASLPLPTWAHALEQRASFTRRVLDPRSGRFAEQRFGHASGRYFGARWAGTTLATTAKRVAFARGVHARADPIAVAAEAKLHPLTPRDRKRLVHHIAAGVSLTAPDPIWVDTVESIDAGRLFVLENRATFARVEIYGGAVAVGTDPWDDLRRRLARTHDYFANVGLPKDGLQRVEVRQGKERMLGLIRMVRRDAGYVAILGLVPLRKWATEREAVAGILRSAVVVD